MNICVICLEKIECKNFITSCKHEYHIECLYLYFYTNNDDKTTSHARSKKYIFKCPICRHHFSIIEVIKLTKICKNMKLKRFLTNPNDIKTEWDFYISSIKFIKKLKQYL